MPKSLSKSKARTRIRRRPMSEVIVDRLCNLDLTRDSDDDAEIITVRKRQDCSVLKANLQAPADRLLIPDSDLEDHEHENSITALHERRMFYLEKLSIQSQVITNMADLNGGVKKYKRKYCRMHRKKALQLEQELPPGGETLHYDSVQALPEENDDEYIERITAWLDSLTLERSWTLH